jgi:hypothetical protein
LNNPPDDYYDLANNHASYKEIIKNITTKYFKKDVFIMGSSMSGTAAIRIGIDMGFNVLSCGPQVKATESIEFAIKSFPKNPKSKLIDDIETLQKQDHWQELTDFVKNHNKEFPPIYLLFNHMRFDTRNAYLFIDELKLKAASKLIAVHTGYKYHGFNIKDKEDVYMLYKILDTLHSIRDIKFSWENN